MNGINILFSFFCFHSLFLHSLLRCALSQNTRYYRRYKPLHASSSSQFRQVLHGKQEPRVKKYSFLGIFVSAPRRKMKNINQLSALHYEDRFNLIHETFLTKGVLTAENTYYFTVERTLSGSFKRKKGRLFSRVKILVKLYLHSSVTEKVSQALEYRKPLEIL